MSAAQALQNAHSAAHSAQSSAVPSPSSSAAPTASSSATSVDAAPADAPKASQSSSLDFDSESAFPSLGATSTASTSGWKGKKPAGQWASAPSTRVNGVNGTASATPAARPAPPVAFTDTLTLPSSAIEVQQPKPQPGKQFVAAPSTLGEVLGQVMKAIPGVRIEASSSRPNNTTTFLFRGPSEAAVRKASREVVQRAVKRSSVTLEVPISTRPYIIGTSGRTLKAISEASNTRIQMPPREDDAVAPEANGEEQMIELTLTGDPEGIEQARNRIMAIVGERAVKASKRITATEIPRDFWPLLAGVKGARLAEIFAAAGLEEGAVTASVPSRRAMRNSDGSLATSSAVEPDDDIQEKKQADIDILLVGSKEAVDAGAQALLAEYQELKRVTRPMTISLPKRQHQFLIGQHADDILAQTGSAVVVPFQDDPSEAVLIIGRKEAFGAAVDMVMTKTESAEVDVVDLATAHRGTHDALQYANDITRYLLVRQKLRAVQDDNSVKIYLPRAAAIATGNTAIEVVGKRDDVAKARLAVAEMVNTLHPQAMKTIQVDPLLHKHLIGKKGAKLKQLEATRGIDVLFPREEEQRSDVLLVYSGKETAANIVGSALDDVANEILQIASETANIRSVVLDIPHKYQGQIVGQNGTTLNAIIGEDKLVRVQLGTSDAGGEDKVTIRGPSKEVERVEKEILRIAEEAKTHEVTNSYTVDFDIDSRAVSHIVGRGGSGINKLREDLGVRVDFADQADGKRKKHTHVTIKGRRENVEEAKRRITAQSERIADETTLSVVMPVDLDRGSLIGKQGSYVQRLEAKYEVKINFPKSTRAVNGDDTGSEASLPAADNSITIRGPKKGAEQARKELLELIDYEKENSQSVSFEIPTRAIPRVFGRNGVLLKQLGDETGAGIDFGRSEGGPTVPVTIKGSKASIADARKRIMSIAREVDDEAVIEMNIDRSLHVTIIGKGGQHIRDMVVRCGGPDDGRAQGSIVRFPRQHEEGDLVTLRGPKDLVEKLRIELEKAVANLRDRTVYGVVVPHAAHASIIGRGGAGVSQFQEKHGVKVVFPGWKEHAQAGEPVNASDFGGVEENDIVKIIGARPACETAAKALASRGGSSSGPARRGGPQKSLSIPHHLHARVAEGGRLAKFARENNVRVDHAGNKAPSSFPMPPRPSRPATNGAAHARIDMDAAEDGDDDDPFLWDVVVFEVETSAEPDVPWNLNGSAENVAAVEAQILDRLESARAATHAAFLQVEPGLMPRLVGRGGSGLERLRSSGVTADVLGKRDADTLIFTGTLAQLESAKEIAHSICQR